MWSQVKNRGGGSSSRLSSQLSSRLFRRRDRNARGRSLRRDGNDGMNNDAKDWLYFLPPPWLRPLPSIWIS